MALPLEQAMKMIISDSGILQNWICIACKLESGLHIKFFTTRQNILTVHWYGSITSVYEVIKYNKNMSKNKIDETMWENRISEQFHEWGKPKRKKAKTKTVTVML